MNICCVLQKNIYVSVCVHTLGALFSFYSGLLCVCILLGVFCAIIRRGREQENTALFIYTAVNSDAACFRFASSVKCSEFQASNTLPPCIPRSFGRTAWASPAMPLLLAGLPSPGIWLWWMWHTPYPACKQVDMLRFEGTTLENVRAASLHHCSAALITKRSSEWVRLWFSVEGAGEGRSNASVYVYVPPELLWHFSWCLSPLWVFGDAGAGLSLKCYCSPIIFINLRCSTSPFTPPWVFMCLGFEAGAFLCLFSLGFPSLTQPWNSQWMCPFLCLDIGLEGQFLPIHLLNAITAGSLGFAGKALGLNPPFWYRWTLCIFNRHRVQWNP